MKMMRKKKKEFRWKERKTGAGFMNGRRKWKEFFFSISADLSITEFFFTGTERNSWNSNISNGRGNYAVHQDNEGHQFVSETIGRDLCRYQIDLHQFEKQCSFVSKKNSLTTESIVPHQVQLDQKKKKRLAKHLFLKNTLRSLE